MSGRADLIVVDLEATCWRGGGARERMETIEIGAVRLDGSRLEPVGEFQRFVRPQVEPVLSEFCRELTGIRQEEVDAAERFEVVWPEFVAWVGEVRWGSWGAYDLGQLRQDCARLGLEFPAAMERHVNLKERFAAGRGLRRPVGMARALRMLGLELVGTHHRAIDDARNIARIVGRVPDILPEG